MAGGRVTAWLHRFARGTGTTRPVRNRLQEGATIVSSKVLFILNDPPYGTERVFNGLRLAAALAKRDGVEERVFLMGDAVVAAMADQKLPDGYYHLDRMLASAAGKGADIGCCATCMDARGITEQMLTKGTRRSTMDELADWTLWADRVVTF
jgi:uncharacterized protein involved in oxidation of intracellular sulfur